ncbi:hypothetical protein [Phosphitispora fastidiosa]|uniref:hypothetical protein n=1 Tax=Phosphitispora fastidiosa TaxID=2837202 RepID=UPI001E2D125C|nr:hypothetical protein [Phosphitispora fastidiosa]MBU7008547.1 polyhydroxyalkanoate synthesis regulator phasin [Phosphitispora fastidiosa]
MRRISIFVTVAILTLIIAGTAYSLTKSKELADYVKNSKNIQGSEDVVLIINDNRITRSEYMVAKKFQQDVTENLRSEKTKIEAMPDSDRKTSILAEINSKLDAGEDIRTLSYFLTTYSLVDEAEKKGLKVSINEAKQYAKEKRKAFDEAVKNSDGKPSEDIEEFISSLGSDFYWEQYVPDKYQKSLMIGKLKNDIVSETIDSEKAKELWNSFVIDTVEKTEVTILDANLINVTKDKVMEFKKLYPGEQ